MDLKRGVFFTDTLVEGDQKINAIKRITQGIKKHGVCVEFEKYDKDIIDKYDFSILPGFFVSHKIENTSRRNKIRKKIYDYFCQNNKQIIIPDTSVFNAYDSEYKIIHTLNTFDVSKYHNLSYDKFDFSRWELIRKKMGISIKNWNIENKPDIVICCQRMSGWRSNGLNTYKWIVDIVEECKLQYPDKNILIRFHPGDSGRTTGIISQLMKKYDFKKNNIKISNKKSLLDDLKNAFLIFNHNSSVSFTSSVQGIPAVLTDINGSFAKKISFETIKTFKDSDRYPNIENEIKKISALHWTREEIENGMFWDSLVL